MTYYVAWTGGGGGTGGEAGPRDLRILDRDPAAWPGKAPQVVAQVETAVEAYAQFLFHNGATEEVDVRYAASILAHPSFTGFNV